MAPSLESGVSIGPPRLWAGLRFLLVGHQARTRELLRQLLATRPGERVLDVCCGVGEFAQEIVDEAECVGVDLNPHFIAAARRRHAAHPRRSFEVMNALALQYPDKSFDRAMFVNGLHHFSDDDGGRLLAELRRVTRDTVVIVDADGTPSGLLRPILFALDRGRFIRTPEALERLIGSVLRIRRAVRYDSGVYSQMIYECGVG